MRRFAYFYFMKNDPEGIGLISFSAESPEQADSLVRNDPFVVADLVAQKWLKEWQVSV